MTEMPGSSVAAQALERDPTASASWTLTLLLALAIFINYIDRGNLATATPLIKSELGLTALQIGLLTSAFFWIYVPGQLTAGWLVDRVGGHRALGFGFALWCVATAMTGLVGGFALLLGLRVLLGIGETVAFPALSKLLAAALPPAELGLANSIATAGVSLGPAFGVLAGRCGARRSVTFATYTASTSCSPGCRCGWFSSTAIRCSAWREFSPRSIPSPARRRFFPGGRAIG